MSKIGKTNIVIPDKVKVALAGNIINIEGPLGKKSINVENLDGLEKELGEKIIEVLTISDSEQTEYEITGLVRLMAQPEFTEIEKKNVITDMLEGDKVLLGQIFCKNINNHYLDVIIGSEHKERKLHDLSLIKISYGLEDAFLGSLAIIGPTRMTYIRIIGVLRVVSELMRKHIGFLLRI